jgi:UDP-glucuronate 4-epimerase
LSFKNPDKTQISKEVIKNDSLSDVAPFRIVNIGNSNPVNLLDFIGELEKILGINAKKNFLGMQDGDVHKTHSNVELLKNLTGFEPTTAVHLGITRFVEWYKSYYKIS